MKVFIGILTVLGAMCFLFGAGCMDSENLTLPIIMCLGGLFTFAGTCKFYWAKQK